MPTFFRDEIILEFTKSSDMPLKISIYNVLGKLVYQSILPYTFSITLRGNELKSWLLEGTFSI